MGCASSRPSGTVGEPATYQRVVTNYPLGSTTTSLTNGNGNPSFPTQPAIGNYQRNYSRPSTGNMPASDQSINNNNNNYTNHTRNISNISLPSPPATATGHPAFAASPLHAAVEASLRSPDESYMQVENILQTATAEVINAVDSRGQTPLHVACRCGAEATVDQLLVHNALLSVRTTDTGDTPLHVVAESGHVGALRSILRSAENNYHPSINNSTSFEHQFDIDSKNNHDASPFYMAVESACAGVADAEDVAEVLLEHGADPNVHCEGVPALHLIAANGLVSLAQFAIARGADVAAVDNEGNLPVHCAARGNSSEMLNLLLQHAPDWISSTNHAGKTPLDVARDGAKIEFLGLLGGVSLLAAASTGDADAAEVAFHASGELEHSLDHNDNTAVHCAAAEGHATVLDRLNTVAPDIFKRCLSLINRDGDKPLHVATKRNQAHSVSHMLSTHPNLAFQVDDSTGNFPMHVAAEANALDVMQVLITSGSNPNALNSFKQTPLHLAAASGDSAADIVQLLLDAGADDSLVDSDGRTAFDLAQVFGYSEIKKILLLQRLIRAVQNNQSTALAAALADGARVSWTAAGDHASKDTALHVAAKNDRWELIEELLVAEGADEAVCLFDEVGDPPLHSAARAGHAQCVSAFLKNINVVNTANANDRYGGSNVSTSADPQQRNAEGKTALHVAARAGFANCILALVNYNSADSNVVNVNEADEDSQATPLHEAAMNVHVDAVKALLNAGASPVAIMVDGSAPLHCAVMWGQQPEDTKEVMRLLIAAGGKLEQRNHAGQTVYDLLPPDDARRSSLSDVFQEFSLASGSGGDIVLPSIVESLMTPSVMPASAPPMESSPETSPLQILMPVQQSTTTGGTGGGGAVPIAGAHVLNSNATKVVYPADWQKFEDGNGGADGDGSAGPTLPSPFETTAVAVAVAAAAAAAVAPTAGPGLYPQIYSAEDSDDEDSHQPPPPPSAQQSLAAINNNDHQQPQGDPNAGKALRAVRRPRAPPAASPFGDSSSLIAAAGGIVTAPPPPAAAAAVLPDHRPLAATLFGLAHRPSTAASSRGASGALSPTMGGGSIAGNSTDRSGSLQVDENLEIPHEKIKIKHDKQLGSGSFGKVYQGLYSAMTVAVKIAVPRNDQNSLLTADVAEQVHFERAMRDFYKEIRIMQRLHHANVQRLFGYANLPEKGLAIVSALAERGSLAVLLQRGKSGQNTKRQLTWARRLHLAHGIASGMNYLHNDLRNPILHRDLKAHNCFVDAHWNALVGDFGLSRDMAPSQNGVSSEGANNPRWLAPELMQAEINEAQYARHSPASDVYSFGMLLYELLTWSPPWHRHNNWAIRSSASRGGRPDIPPIDGLPGELQDTMDFSESGGLDEFLMLMKACWAQNPEDRPGFMEIEPQLERMKRKELARRGEDDDGGGV